MEDILTRIQELQGQLESIRRADRYRQELARNLSGQLSKLDRLKKAMDKEHRDVIQLEEWSIKELFVKVIDKEEKLEAEKEEYLQAAVAFQEAKKEADLIEYEIGVLQDKISGKKELESQLQKLYDRREADILKNKPDHPLRKNLEELARWKQIDRELDEAISHGASAQVILEEIAGHLNRAKTWAHHQLQDNGYRTRMITEEVDHARLRLPKLRLELVKFEEQLKEAFQYPELEGWSHDHWEGFRQIGQLVSELSEFGHNFLQHMIRAWNLQKQLHQSHTLADHIRHQTGSAVKWLQIEQTRVKKKVNLLEEEKRKLLS